MNLHEYQGKEILASFGVRIQRGIVAHNAKEAVEAAKQLTQETGTGWHVIKAQVHAGGRGQAGGIRIVENKKGLTEVVKNLLGTRLITHQTDSRGQPIDSVYLVKPCLIDRELYLSAVVDRARCCVTFMVCSEGGVDIESTVEHHPEKVYKFHVDCLEGVLRYECVNAATVLGLKKEQVTKFVQIVNSLYDLLISHDISTHVHCISLILIKHSLK